MGGKSGVVDSFLVYRLHCVTSPTDHCTSQTVMPRKANLNHGLHFRGFWMGQYARSLSTTWSIHITICFICVPILFNKLRLNFVTRKKILFKEGLSLRFERLLVGFLSGGGVKGGTARGAEKKSEFTKVVSNYF